MRRGLLILVLLAVSAPAQAYYLESRTADGEPLRYDTTMPIQFRVGMEVPMGLDDGEVTAAIAAAFQTWEDEACSNVAFEAGPRVAMPMGYHWMTMMAGERYIQVYWSSDPAAFPGGGVGFFLIGHNGMGTMIGADIVLNAAYAWSTTGEAAALDIQGTVTALIGRSLGITSDMMGNATYPRYMPGDISKRTLGTDDVNAIQYLYGDMTMCMPPAPTGVCNGVDPACPPTPMTGSDGGVPGDDGGMTGTDSGVPPVTDGGTMGTDSGVPRTDAGTGGGGGDGDDGCCSVAPGASRDGSAAAAAFLALLGAAAIRRRRRK